LAVAGEVANITGEYFVDCKVKIPDHHKNNKKIIITWGEIDTRRQTFWGLGSMRNFQHYLDVLHV